MRTFAPITPTLTPTLTKAQAAGRRAMLRNGGWAKKGGTVSRRTVGGLVALGVAQWTINVPGGHWAAHLAPGPGVLLVDEAREEVAAYYPQAHDFQTVTADAGRTLGYIFQVDYNHNARYGWITMDRSYSKGTELCRSEATARLSAAVLEDGRAAFRRAGHTF